MKFFPAGTYVVSTSSASYLKSCSEASGFGSCLRGHRPRGSFSDDYPHLRQRASILVTPHCSKSFPQRTAVFDFLILARPAIHTERWFFTLRNHCKGIDDDVERISWKIREGHLSARLLLNGLLQFKVASTTKFHSCGWLFRYGSCLKVDFAPSHNWRLSCISDF